MGLSLPARTAKSIDEFKGISSQSQGFPYPEHIVYLGRFIHLAHLAKRRKLEANMLAALTEAHDGRRCLGKTDANLPFLVHPLLTSVHCVQGKSFLRSLDLSG